MRDDNEAQRCSPLTIWPFVLDELLTIRLQPWAGVQGIDLVSREIHQQSICRGAVLAYQRGAVPDANRVSRQGGRPHVGGMRALGSERVRIHEQTVEEDR